MLFCLYYSRYFRKAAVLLELFARVLRSECLSKSVGHKKSHLDINYQLECFYHILKADGSFKLEQAIVQTINKQMLYLEALLVVVLLPKWLQFTLVATWAKGCILHCSAQRQKFKTNFTEDILRGF